MLRVVVVLLAVLLCVAHGQTETTPLRLSAQKVVGSRSRNARFGSVVAVDGGVMVTSQRRPRRYANAYVSEADANGVWGPVTSLTPSWGSGPPPFTPADASVAVSGGTVVIGVGAPEDLSEAQDPPTGSAYIFDKSSGAWELQQVLSGAVGDGFGSQVAIEGDDMVVAASVGKLFSYKRSAAGGSWELVGSPFEDAGVLGTIINESDFRRLGPVLALQGDTLIVGVPSKVGAGSVLVLERDASSSWALEQTLTPSRGQESDHFGTSVAIDGDVVVVGSLAGGNAYVFTRDATGVFAESAVIPAPLPESGFAKSVALQYPLAIVCAPEINVSAGLCYGYEDVAGTWTLVAELGASDASTRAYFGDAIAWDGGEVVVGAYSEDGFSSTIASAGAVYTFDSESVFAAAPPSSLCAEEGKKAACTALGHCLWGASPESSAKACHATADAEAWVCGDYPNKNQCLWNDAKIDGGCVFGTIGDTTGCFGITTDAVNVPCDTWTDALPCWDVGCVYVRHPFTEDMTCISAVAETTWTCSDYANRHSCRTNPSNLGYCLWTSIKGLPNSKRCYAIEELQGTSVDGHELSCASFKHNEACWESSLRCNWSKGVCIEDDADVHFIETVDELRAANGGSLTVAIESATEETVPPGVVVVATLGTVLAAVGAVMLVRKVKKGPSTAVQNPAFEASAP